MDVSLLPPNIKMMILGHTDATTRLEVLKVLPEVGYDKIPLFSQLRASLRDQPDDIPTKRLISNEELQLLENRGFIVKDNFSNADLNELHNEVLLMRSTDLLKSANMSSATQQAWNDPNTRGDLHYWLNDAGEQLKTQFPILYELLQSMDALRLELNDTCNFQSEKVQVRSADRHGRQFGQHFFLTRFLKTQIACYPGKGARYVRHLDSSKNGPDRRITCLFYLNKDWKTENGGSLRIFLPRSPETESLGNIVDNEVEIDVEPLLNRVVMFQSRTIPHEVLPTHTDRMSITMWFY